MATPDAYAEQLGVPAEAQTRTTVQHDVGVLQRWRERAAERKRTRLISARSRRMLTQRLRRVAKDADDRDPIRRRHDVLLHYRAAAVYGCTPTLIQRRYTDHHESSTNSAAHVEQHGPARDVTVSHQIRRREMKTNSAHTTRSRLSKASGAATLGASVLLAIVPAAHGDSATTYTLRCGTNTYTVEKSNENSAAYTDGTTEFITAIGAILSGGSAQPNAVLCTINGFGPVPFVITPSH